MDTTDGPTPTYPPHLEMIFLLPSVTVVSSLNLNSNFPKLSKKSESSLALKGNDFIWNSQSVTRVQEVVFYLWMKASLACSMTLQTPCVLDRSDAIKKQRRNVTSAAPSEHEYQKWYFNQRNMKDITLVLNGACGLLKVCGGKFSPRFQGGEKGRNPRN